MDPLTSLSLTCAIVQLVDFSSKLIKGTAEIYGSATGATLQDASLKFHTQHLKGLTSDLDHGASSRSGPLEKNLQELAGECQMLSDQLLRCQLTLYLNALMRSEMKERLESLAQSQASNAQQFASLERLIRKLHEGVHVTSLDGDIKNQLGGLLGFSGKTYDSMRKDRILKSLSFKTMRRRFEQFHPAHAGTFDWILREGSFVDWLSHGQSVFHIAGKPGSGKSTLVRFLCHDPRTDEILKQWATDSHVVRANFFFWRHGESDLQRNLEGLFRGLLHDSLINAPI
ncbi:NACHT domain-containing protein [Fusarium sp. Ph1]|nr:NACHT domain-containing protein [Fusarium sp. Ph1]